MYFSKRITCALHFVQDEQKNLPKLLSACYGFKAISVNTSRWWQFEDYLENEMMINVKWLKCPFPGTEIAVTFPLIVAVDY